jgi:hypothetical protein
MEIDESDDIIWSKTHFITSVLYDNDLEFMNCNGRIDDVGVSDESESGVVGRAGEVSKG